MKYILSCILILFFTEITAVYGEEIILTPAEKEWLAQDYTVRIRIANWPPFQFGDASNPQGISVDYIEYIFNKNKIKYSFVSGEQIPWQRALECIRDKKKIDLLLTVKKTAEREKYMLFTDTYISAPWVVFTKEDYPAITGVGDLKGKTVVVQENYVMHDLLKINYPEIKLKMIRGANVTEKALLALAIGNADAYIGNLATGSYLARSLNLLNIKVAAPTPFGKHDNSMGTRDDWPELVSIINKTLLFMPKTEKDTLVSNYSKVRYDHGLSYIDIVFWVMLSLFVCGSIIFIFLKVNRRLNQEIIQRKQAEQDMKEYIALVDDNIVSLSFDADGIITHASNAFCKQSKYLEDEVIGLFFKELWSGTMPDSTYMELLEEIKINACWIGEIEKKTKDGSTYWVRANVSAKFDSHNNLISYTAIGHDITDKKKVELLSITDKLTGIFNRLKLDETFSYEIKMSKRYQDNFSIIIIDIDDFKEVNDTCGHNVGDIALKEVAKLLQESIRKTDTVGRWGGEEFLILCPKTSLPAALLLAEKLRATLADNEFSTIRRLTISLGVATYKENDTEMDMTNRADAELYHAKAAGENCVYPKYMP